MIRPFQLRDLALVHRLGERGVILQAEPALTSSPHPLRSALVNMLVGGRYSTYVWKADAGDGAAFVQLRCEEGNPIASLTCLGVAASNADPVNSAEVDEDAWLSLLDELVAQIGKIGIHSLVAEVDETGPELPVLRRAGFAVYTRQDVWVKDSPSGRVGPTLLVPREPIDDWDIHVLYAGIVPRLIQAVEPNPPLEQGENWVLREGNDLAALVHIRRGPVGSWMRLLIHPNAHVDAVDVVEEALSTREPAVDHPLYCCVRRYQSWLQGPLEAAGFRYWGGQAVMVKHIVQRVEKSVPVMSGVLEAQTVAGSSPIVQSFSRPYSRRPQKVQG